MSQVRRLNENSNRRYQLYDRRFKNLLRKIHTDSREKPEKNSEVSWCHNTVLLLSLETLHARPKDHFIRVLETFSWFLRQHSRFQLVVELDRFLT